MVTLSRLLPVTAVNDNLSHHGKFKIVVGVPIVDVVGKVMIGLCQEGP